LNQARWPEPVGLSRASLPLGSIRFEVSTLSEIVSKIFGSAKLSVLQAFLLSLPKAINPVINRRYYLWE
jgi:hypothetical protein